MIRLPSRRTALRALALSAVAVAAVVWAAFQFPGLFASRLSSVEVVEEVFAAPVEMTEAAAAKALGTINREAVVLFIRSFDLPARPRERLIAEVRSKRTREVTLPFIFYLQELYGAGQDSPELDYEEPGQSGELESGELEQQAGENNQPGAPGDGLPGAAEALVSPRWRRHIRNVLLLYDALFLQVKPGADAQSVHWRYDEAAYQDVKRILRRMGRDLLGKPDDALNAGESTDQAAKAALEEVLADDERLTDFAEFFADFVRDLSDRWLRSFVRRDQRRRLRLEWVEDRIARRRYYEIADYARGQADRKLVLHVVVDGLQGKLVEGLAQLADGDRSSPGARYVIELVRRHRRPAMDPSSYPAGEQCGLPGLGTAIQELARDAPRRDDYLENLRKYFLDSQARAVRVNVATVDTPTISVRNLPIVYHGHGVAGPHGMGIPNFSYLDRRTQRGWYFWGSDILHFRRIFANQEDEIPGGIRREGPGARTLFERLWRYNTVSAMATVDNGALEIISAEVGVGAGEIQRDYMARAIVENLRRRAGVENQLNRRRRWLAEHRNLNHGLLAELVFNAVDLKTFRDHARWIARHEDEGLPDYLLWYNPWPDHFAHGKGPFSDEILGYRGEFDRFDFYFGKIMEAYHSLSIPANRPAMADRLLVGLVSDHGLVYTPRLVSADVMLFEAMRQEGIRLKVRKLSVDEGELPTIQGRGRFAPTRPYDAVVGSTAGGSYVIDLFSMAGLKGNDRAWRRHPDYHQLRRHALLSGQTVDWIDRLGRHLGGVIDIAVVREYGPSAGEAWPEEVVSSVRIVGPGRGESRIVRVAGGAGAARYRYEVLSGSDPLDLSGSVRGELLAEGGPGAGEARQVIGGLIASSQGGTDRAWQEALGCTLRADSIHQLSHLYDTPRAGTINIFPVGHVGINSSVPGRHAGEMFEEKNGIQVYWGGGLGRGTIQTARNGSLPVTLYHWFVGDKRFTAAGDATESAAAEQFGYPSLLPEVFQFSRVPPGR